MLLNIILIFALNGINFASPVAKLSAKADNFFRLPEEVRPTNYKLQLRLEEDAFEKNEYTGELDIALTINSTDPNFFTNVIKLHHIDLIITDNILYKGSQKFSIVNNPYNPENNVLSLETFENFTLGDDYRLNLKFSGKLRPNTDMRGFYKSSYIEDDGKEHFVAATQFENTHARKAFPCFDEPNFKATFDISFVYPKPYSAVSNTPIKTGPSALPGILESVTFETTPHMSSYLVAFVISEFTPIPGESTNGIPTEIYARKGSEKAAETALKVSPQILDVMEDYTHYAYNNSKIGKLTQAAIPDFGPGAMENWGLVNYKEVYLLWDKDESSASYLQKVVTIIAHELSHQWFGNLVTMDWWSELFLNEGFATYFEYHAPDNIPDYKNWELSQQIVVEQVQTALAFDSGKDTIPLEFDTGSVTAAGRIYYNKGGSVLRMLHYIVHLDNFKSGLRDYIGENAFGNTKPDDLWKFFDSYTTSLPEQEKPPVKISEVMKLWTKQVGYPLLTVSGDGKNATITQEHFVTTGTQTQQTWYVPITYTLANDDGSAPTNTQDWLEPNKTLIISNVFNNSDWIILNNQQTAYYRVDYGDDLWGKISNALKKDNPVHRLSRAQLVDDLFAIAQTKKRSYTNVLRWLSFLENESEYYPWYSAFSGFTNLLKRTGSSSLRTRLSALILDFTKSLRESVSFEVPASHIEILKQNLALNWVCKLGDESCVNEAKKRLADYIKTNQRPNKELRNIVYCNGLRYSDNATNDWEFLWNAFERNTIPSETNLLLSALGCTTDIRLLKKYLGLVIQQDSKIRSQDSTFAFNSVYNSNPQGADAILEFLAQNYTEIIAYSESTLTSMIGSVSDLLATQEQINQLQAFLDDNNDKLSENVKKAVQDGVNRAKDNLATTIYLESELAAYFLKGGANTFAISITLFISVITLLVLC